MTAKVPIMILKPLKKNMLIFFFENKLRKSTWLKALG
jgi:hypothetical protein